MDIPEILMLLNHLIYSFSACTYTRKQAKTWFTFYLRIDNFSNPEHSINFNCFII